MHERASDSDDDTIVNTGSVLSVTINELANYNSVPQSPMDVNPLDWWKIHETTYPVLALMARDYLAGQASSVAIEEVFSSGADTTTSDRSRLSGHSIRECLCLKYWLK